MPYQLLFADDSATMHRVVQITFAREDFSVIGVNNGPAAIAKAKEVKPDVAVIDISMPGMDGYAVCQALKADPSTAQIPVLLLAGSQEPFDEARAKASGANSHVVKPFETQVLIERVKALVGAPATVAAPAARPAAPAPAPKPTTPAVAAPAARVAAPVAAPGPWAPPPSSGSPRPPSAAPAPPPTKPAAAPTAAPAAQVAEPTPFAAAVPQQGPAFSAPRNVAPLAPPITTVSAAPARPVPASATPTRTPAATGGAGPADASALRATVQEIIEQVVWDVVPDRFEALIRERADAILREHMDRLAKSR